MGVLDLGLVGQEGGGPDLAVGMRVGTAHHCSFVFKDLNPSENKRGQLLKVIKKGPLVERRCPLPKKFYLLIRVLKVVTLGIRV